MRMQECGVHSGWYRRPSWLSGGQRVCGHLVANRWAWYLVVKTCTLSIGDQEVGVAKRMTLLAVLLVGVAFHWTLARGESSCPDYWVKVKDECLRVELAQTEGGQDSRVTWNTARVFCQSFYFGADLAIMDDSERLEALYDYVAAHYPDETSKGWAYWVGGYKVNSSHWRWVNEEEINLRSHVWLPSAPEVDNTVANTLLVPANQDHGRFYLSQQTKGSTAPAYVCQNLAGLRPFGSPL